MKYITKTTLYIIICCFLSCCAVMPVSNYSPASFANVRDLEQDKDNLVTLAVAPFTTSVKQTSLVCRPGHPIKLTPGQHFGHYIRSALIMELKSANMYYKYSPRQIACHLNKVSFTADVFGNGAWNIDATFTGKTAKGKTIGPFKINASYKYFVSTKEEDFCQHIADAFPDAVQMFLNNLINNPNFRKILQ